MDVNTVLSHYFLNYSDSDEDETPCRSSGSQSDIDEDHSELDLDLWQCMSRRGLLHPCVDEDSDDYKEKKVMTNKGRLEKRQ